jgi:hypothetical protein
VRALQDIVPALFDTGSFDAARIDPHIFSKNREQVGMVWIDAKPELIVGEIKDLAERNKVGVEQVAGYWYGKRDPTTGRVGQRAGPDEKVMYALHGAWNTFRRCLMTNIVVTSGWIRGKFFFIQDDPKTGSQLLIVKNTDRISSANRHLGCDVQRPPPRTPTIQQAFGA